MSESRHAGATREGSEKNNGGDPPGERKNSCSRANPFEEGKGYGKSHANAARLENFGKVHYTGYCNTCAHREIFPESTDWLKTPTCLISPRQKQTIPEGIIPAAGR